MKMYDALLIQNNPLAKWVYLYEDIEYGFVFTNDIKGDLQIDEQVRYLDLKRYEATKKELNYG